MTAFFLEVNISFGFYLVSVCGSKFAEFCCCVHLGCFDFVVVIWRLLLLFFVWGLFVSVLSSMIHIWMQKILKHCDEKKQKKEKRREKNESVIKLNETNWMQGTSVQVYNGNRRTEPCVCVYSLWSFLRYSRETYII